MRSIDKPAGEIVVGDGQLIEIDMPPMTMASEVSETEMLDKVKAGDRVTLRVSSPSGKWIPLTLMENLMRFLLYSLLLLANAPAFAAVILDNPWARATPPAATIAGGYMVIRNTDFEPDRLIGASSPVSERVEMHVTSEENGVMRMRQQESLPVPAGGRLELKPGAGHLMLVGLKRPLKQGESVPLLLHFQRAGEIRTELHVEALGARRHSH